MTLALLALNLAVSLYCGYKLWSKGRYDHEGTLARDAVAHAEQVSAGNVKRYGGGAKMGPDDKLKNAIEYGKLHWHGLRRFNEVRFRRRIEVELGRGWRP